jgi:hypothetical protein
MDKVSRPRASDFSKQEKIESLIKEIGMLMMRYGQWRRLTIETMSNFESRPGLSIENVSFGNIRFKLQYTADPASEQDSPDWCVDIKLYRNGNIIIRNQRIAFLSDIIDTLLMIKESLEMDFMDLIGTGTIGTGRPFSIQWYIGKTAEIERESAYATTGDTDID